MSQETQPERTRLAWSRTALALLIVGALFLRWLPEAGLLALIPVVASTVIAAGIVGAQHRRYPPQALDDTSADTVVVSVLLTTAGVALLGGTAMIAIAAA